MKLSIGPCKVRGCDRAALYQGFCMCCYGDYLGHYFGLIISKGKSAPKNEALIQRIWLAQKAAEAVEVTK